MKVGYNVETYCTCIATISLSSHASLVTQQCSRGQTCEHSVGKEGTYARVKYRVYVHYSTNE